MHGARLCRRYAAEAITVIMTGAVNAAPGTAASATGGAKSLCRRKETTMSDTVNHPTHYNSSGVECIEAIRSSMTADGFCDYCKGNIIKYIWRWRDKGGIEDLKKAQVYLGWLIEAVDDDSTR